MSQIAEKGQAPVKSVLRKLRSLNRVGEFKPKKNGICGFVTC